MMMKKKEKVGKEADGDRSVKNVSIKGTEISIKHFARVES